MDVEEPPGLAGMLGITGTPTFFLFRAGEPVNKSVGYRSKEALFAAVRDWLDAKGATMSHKAERFVCLRAKFGCSPAQPKKRGERSTICRLIGIHMLH